MSLTAVVAGNYTNATDINQIINAWNGAADNQIVPTNTATGGTVLIPTITAAPASDTAIVACTVSGDSGTGRSYLYVRGADGYGGLAGGTGTTTTAHLYAQSYGWYIPETLEVGGNGGFAGNMTSTSLNVNGPGTITGNLTMGGQVLGNSSQASALQANGSSSVILQAHASNAGWLYGGNTSGISCFSGVGSGTYSHGLSVTPAAILVTISGSGNVCRVTVTSKGATTCYIYVDQTGASFDAVAISN